MLDPREKLNMVSATRNNLRHVFGYVPDGQHRGVLLQAVFYLMQSIRADTYPYTSEPESYDMAQRSSLFNECLFTSMIADVLQEL